MNTINKLEREWKIYKQRERRPYLIALSISVFILALLITFLSSEAAQTPLKTDDNLSQKNPELLSSKPSENNESSPISLQKPESSVLQELRPSFEFMKDIKEEPLEIERKNSYKRREPTSSLPKQAIEEIKSDAPAKQQRGVEVTSTSSEHKIDALAKRFNSSRNPILGITVAKQYLRNKQYKQSYFYALEVNNIDKKNEDSWLVSAESLYYLNNKEGALNMLKSYLQKNNSTKALKLYRAIQQGRLK